MLEIKTILEDNNVNFVFHPKSESLPVDKIDIELVIENYPENLPNLIELVFVPGIEEATDGLTLLQFYAALNLEINEKEVVKVDLMRLMSDINYTLAAGAFILSLNENIIYLKYNLAIDRSQDKDLELKLSRTIWLINRHFDTYTNLFVEINNENLSYSDIKTKGILKD
jgi:hypothetical protein